MGGHTVSWWLELRRVGAGLVWALSSCQREGQQEGIRRQRVIVTIPHVFLPLIIQICMLTLPRSGHALRSLHIP